MTISQRLFKIMDAERISVSELSARTGISKQTIYDWKKKGTNPSSDKIMILCEALSITPEELLVGTPEEDVEDMIFLTEDKQTEFDGFTIEIAKYINGMTEFQKKRIMAYIAKMMNIKG